MSTHTPINDGGPAFPGTEENGMNSGMPGMTLRDYFAAKALQAQHTAFSAMEQWHGWTEDEMAADAYKKADAMLKARSTPIAAAPDLLAELQAIADANPNNWDAPLNDTRSFQEWAQSRARAAVQKATSGAA